MNEANVLIITRTLAINNHFTFQGQRHLLFFGMATAHALNATPQCACANVRCECGHTDETLQMCCTILQ